MTPCAHTGGSRWLCKGRKQIVPGKPPVVRVVSAEVLNGAPARIARAANGRLEVMLRSDLKLTAPVGDLITDAIDSEWPRCDDEPAIGQRELVQQRQPTDGQATTPSPSSRGIT
jgi:hypothetical protein